MKGWFFFLLLMPCLCRSQKTGIMQVADEISTVDLRANVNKLSSPEMEGRLAGTRGDSLAAAFIAGWYKKYQLLAPYEKGNSYYQRVPLRKMEITKGEITAYGNKYLLFNDWYAFAGSMQQSIRFDSLPVVFGGFGIESDRYNDLLGINVEGKAVIILQAQPSDSIAELLSSASRSSISADYQKNLADRGAAVVLVVTNDFERASRALKTAGTTRAYRNASTSLNKLPRIYVSEKMVNELLLPNDVSLNSLRINMRRINRPLSFQTKTRLGINVQIDSVNEQALNVIGILKGKDTAAAPVIMSAHHDHLGKRGAQVFAGAVDNASGTAALMEVAKLLQKAELSGLRPRRTIIFAAFSGQEAGQLGSAYYQQHPADSHGEPSAVYNLEMLGSVDSFHAQNTVNYSYYLVRDTLARGLERALVTASESVQVQLDNRYQQSQSSFRWLAASDLYTFYSRGIPVIQTGAGYPKEYHLVTDTPEKIDYALLSIQAKLAFLTLYTIANN